jgi:heat shock protein 90kDa beta
VRRVFISDEFALMPKYLSFVRGVVDSDTLPLNIGRETLQHHSALKVIKKKLVRKTLDMIKKIADDSNKEAEAAAAEGGAEEADKKSKYDKFYDQFGKSIRMGVLDDSDNRNRLSKLLRFTTTTSGARLTSLEQYVARMKEGQKGIYYLGGSNMDELKASPFLEQLQEEGFEVILFADPLDEYVLTQLHEFDGKKLMDASKEGLAFTDKHKAAGKKLEEAFAPLTKWWRGVAAEEDSQVDSVKISTRLARSPCIVVVSGYGYSANMQRVMKERKGGKKKGGRGER